MFGSRYSGDSGFFIFTLLKSFHDKTTESFSRVLSGSCGRRCRAEVNATVIIDTRLLVGQDRTALSGLANDVQII